MKPIMNIEEIMKVLHTDTHFYWWIEFWKRGTERLVAIKNLTMNEEFFQGHFRKTCDARSVANGSLGSGGGTINARTRKIPFVYVYR